MNRYKVSACGYEIEVKASSFHTAVSRALRVLKADGDYKESDQLLSVRAKNLGPVRKKEEAS